MRLTRRFVLVTAAAFSLAGRANAAGEWTVLGAKSVNLIYDHDIIPVGVKDGLFTGLKIRVSGHAVYFNEIQVTFSNGEKVDLSVRRFIRAGEETREMLLPGLVRAIRVVELRYRRVAGGGSARVTVSGRRAKR